MDNRMMKRSIVFLICFFVTTVAFGQRPRVVVLATGGTIAGSAESSSQAAYTAGVLSVEQLMASVPDIEKLAELETIQICNISSQNMEEWVWFRLYRTIDSLFSNKLCEGVVITHGTDTMEETAYFLHLTLRHPYPVILTGAMRPATAISADGPLNLYNSVALAAAPTAHDRGVMVVVNDYIFSADDVTKDHTVNVDAFSSPNYGPLGYIRNGVPLFFRAPRGRNTTTSDFSLTGCVALPKVEIVPVYAFASSILADALIDAGVDGMVISGVGHGNFNDPIAEAMERAYAKGIVVVRSSRIAAGGVNLSVEKYDTRFPVSFYKTPQKARILLMLALTETKNPEEIQRIFLEY